MSSFRDVTVTDTQVALCSANHSRCALKVTVPHGGSTVYVGPTGVATTSARVRAGETARIEVDANAVAYGIADTGVSQVVTVEKVNAANVRVPNLVVPGTPVAFTQTYSTTATTVPAATYTAPAVTVGAHTFPVSGNLFDAVANDLLINVRTDSTANAVADQVINTKSIAANVNQAVTDLLATNAQLAALAVDVLELKKLIGKLIDIDQAAGLAS